MRKYDKNCAIKVDEINYKYKVETNIWSIFCHERYLLYDVTDKLMTNSITKFNNYKVKNPNS